MNRRNFIKSCVGGAAALVLPLSIGSEVAKQLKDNVALNGNPRKKHAIKKTNIDEWSVINALKPKVGLKV